MMSREPKSTPVQTPRAMRSIEVQTPDGPWTFDLAGAIRLALGRAGISQKQAAYTMEVDPSFFSRQLAGADHVWLDRLLLLPMTFWTAFLPLLAEPFGCTVESDDADRVIVSRALEALSLLVRRLQSVPPSRRSG